MILPAFKDAREFLGQNAISYSEISSLASCEKKWDLVYNAVREEYLPTDAMALGSEMHRLLGLWWSPGAPRWMTENPTAHWLMHRYDEHYMAENAPLQMEALEVPFAVKHFGTWIFGWMDGLVRNLETGELWIAEFKTMGNWSKLNQLPVDKQVTLYIYAARAAGYDVKGVMFDAIRTYRWTGKNADQHEPAESFRREWVTRTDEEIFECLEEVESAVSIRNDLLGLNGGRAPKFARMPLRNVGMNCGWCPVMPQCYGIDLELTDDANDHF